MRFRLLKTISSLSSWIGNNLKVLKVSTSGVRILTDVRLQLQLTFLLNFLLTFDNCSTSVSDDF